MADRYGTHEIIDARATFWNLLKPISQEIGISDLQGLLRQTGMPPGVPVGSGDLIDTARSLQNGSTVLSPPAALLWCLTCRIYPWDSSVQSELGEYGSAFDVARRTLANFWNISLKKAAIEQLEIVAEVGRHFDAAKHQVFLLSWLELPLVLKTGDSGKGKVGLFSLGEWFVKN